MRESVCDGPEYFKIQSLETESEGVCGVNKGVLRAWGEVGVYLHHGKVGANVDLIKRRG